MMKRNLERQPEGPQQAPKDRSSNSRPYAAKCSSAAEGTLPEDDGS
jgi:hypothetical protein